MYKPSWVYTQFKKSFVSYYSYQNYLRMQFRINYVERINNREKILQIFGKLLSQTKYCKYSLLRDSGNRTYHLVPTESTTKYYKVHIFITTFLDFT